MGCKVKELRFGLHKCRTPAALLHVDEQASRRCGYEEAFSAKKVEIFQHMH